MTTAATGRLVPASSAGRPLGLSRRNVQAMIRAGAVPAFRVGGRTLVSPERLAEALQRSRVPAAGADGSGVLPNG